MVQYCICTIRLIHFQFSLRVLVQNIILSAVAIGIAYKQKIIRENHSVINLHLTFTTL